MTYRQQNQNQHSRPHQHQRPHARPHHVHTPFPPFPHPMHVVAQPVPMRFTCKSEDFRRTYTRALSLMGLITVLLVCHPINGDVITVYISRNVSEEQVRTWLPQTFAGLRVQVNYVPPDSEDSRYVEEVSAWILGPARGR